MRIYLSNFGTIQPHYDVPMCYDDTHTCLIYLTDDFIGGNLTIEYDNKKNTYIPKKMNGVIFPKYVMHYTDELIKGEKIILLLDLKIM